MLSTLDKAAARLRTILALMMCMALLAPLPLLAQTRPVALVIGQNDYQQMKKLDNAVNDAQAIASSLRARGFDVTLLTNIGAKQMRQALAEYRSRLTASRLGVIYFAGHGAQVGNDNVLVPVDLPDVSIRALTQQSVTLRELVNTLAPAQPEALAIILDACRDNPLLSAQVQKKGLGEPGLNLPTGFMVIYGASVGQTALDSASPGGSVGTPDNGLFTARFIHWFAKPSLSLRQVMRRTRVDVMEAARQMDHQQLPSVYDTLVRNSRFHALTSTSPDSPAPHRAPSGPIRLIVPAAAGGPTDAIARALVRYMQTVVGQPIRIENIIDIPGLRVADLVGSTLADGQTLLLSSYQASLARMRRGDQRLTAIGMVTETPIILATHTGNDVHNLQQMLQSQRSSGKPLSVGISGPSSPSEACAAELRRVWGNDTFETVAYRGSAPALADLLAGKIDLNCDQAILFGPHIASKRIRPLANLQEDAVGEVAISAAATAQAQGYAAVVPNWTALFAHTSTDAAIVRHLSAALQRVLAEPAFDAELRRFLALPVTPEKGVPLEVDLSLKVGLEVSP
jgi:tripartite-type tricarboxylate transporter receptor subunit TctC